MVRVSAVAAALCCRAGFRIGSESYTVHSRARRSVNPPQKTASLTVLNELRYHFSFCSATVARVPSRGTKTHLISGKDRRHSGSVCGLGHAEGASSWGRWHAPTGLHAWGHVGWPGAMRRAVLGCPFGAPEYTTRPFGSRADAGRPNPQRGLRRRRRRGAAVGNGQEREIGYTCRGVPAGRTDHCGAKSQSCVAARRRSGTGDRSGMTRGRIGRRNRYRFRSEERNWRGAGHG